MEKSVFLVLSRVFLLRGFLGIFLIGLFSSVPAFGFSRIKDITFVEGVRDNQILGYGIVVGLNGTGDSTGAGEFTSQTIKAITQRFGVKTDTLSSDNVAAVMVSASLPAYALPGSTIDITVSSLADATSLKGGTLLLTPLVGATGEVYAVAQGKVTIPTAATTGFLAGGASIETNGRIISGAIVEKQSGQMEDHDPNIRLSLRNPDFTTATRISDAVNAYMGQVVAHAPNPATVVINKPEEARKDPVSFMEKIEKLKVEVDEVARIVIDSQSGVVVMGQNVRISKVAIALDNITIQIGSTGEAQFLDNPGGESESEYAYRISDPSGDAGGGVFGGGNTTSGLGPRVVSLEQGVSIQSLVRNLNALGVSTKDLIRILENIKAQGALQAEIQIV